MIFDARNSLRRCTTVTFSANFARKIASSIARVAAADDDRLLVLEERGVAGRAVRDAAAGELLLAADLELLVLGAHRQDDGAGAGRSSSPTLTLWMPPGSSASSTSVAWSVRKRRAEALGLVAHRLHELRAHDPVAEAGVVLDLGRLLEQAAPEEALDDERLEVRARGVQRGGVAGRPAADDDDVLDPVAHGAHFI